MGEGVRQGFRGAACWGASRRSARGLEFAHGGYGEAVDLFVEGVAVVAAHPLPLNGAFVDERLHANPEIRVGVALPVLGHGVDDVLAIAVNGDLGSGWQGGEAFDDAEHLHAVVGGGGVTAGERSLGYSVHDDGTPAARTRIAAA